jgi:hypothetical protein
MSRAESIYSNTAVALSIYLSPHSIAKLLASWMTAALEELYTVETIPLFAISPLMLAINTIDPLHFHCICFAAAVAVKTQMYLMLVASVISAD